MITILRNPAILTDLKFCDFLRRAFTRSPWSYGEVTQGFQTLVSSPLVNIFLAVEDGAYVGIGILTLPTPPLETIPQVVHLYNEGTHGLGKAIGQAMVDLIGKKGYTTFWALNYSGMPDEKWLKVVQPDGWEGNPIGSVVNFKVKT